jgi:hypothetical protein
MESASSHVEVLLRASSFQPPAPERELCHAFFFTSPVIYGATFFATIFRGNKEKEREYLNDHVLSISASMCILFSFFIAIERYPFNILIGTRLIDCEYSCLYQHIRCKKMI